MNMKPQQWKKEESERLRGEGDKIKFIYPRFERWQVAGSRKGRRRQYNTNNNNTNDIFQNSVLIKTCEFYKKLKSHYGQAICIWLT